MIMQAKGHKLNGAVWLALKPEEKAMDKECKWPQVMGGFSPRAS